MLKTRITTAILLITGLIIVLLNASHSVWSLLTLGITLIAMWEWSNLIQLDKLQTVISVCIAFVIGLCIFYLLRAPFALYQQSLLLSILGVATLFWLIVAPLILATRCKVHNKLFMSMLGLLLLLATWVGLSGLHQISAWLVLAVIGAVSIADSAAYFAGKRFGRHKLAPSISPGKTWEGVLGALIASTLYGALICYHLNYSYWLIIGFWLIAILSIVGDLFESLLKRQAGLKDSSQLLPGHGGVLDRIDGIMPTMATVFFFTYSPFFSALQAHA